MRKQFHGKLFFIQKTTLIKKTSRKSFRLDMEQLTIEHFQGNQKLI